MFVVIYPAELGMIIAQFTVAIVSLNYICMLPVNVLALQAKYDKIKLTLVATASNYRCIQSFTDYHSQMQKINIEYC